MNSLGNRLAKPGTDADPILSQHEHKTVALQTLLSIAASLLLVTPLWSQLEAPNYEECRLDSVFPAGGRQGTSVSVEFRGFKGGLAGPSKILIDGPPGITAGDLKATSNNNIVQATLTIAPDAPPGRRWLRVASERSGLTYFAHFVVGGLPEHVEKEPNNEPDKAEEITLPVVVNGRVNPKADMDCYRFAAKKGEKLVVAVAAHSLDIHGQGSNYGIADFTLELLDDQGRIVAESLDELGYDPLIHVEIPRTATYAARVKMVSYGGFPEAVYRLTIGEVPYVTSVFPPGVQRGTSKEVELFGPNVPAGTKRTITAGKDDWFPLEFITMPGISSGQDVAIHRGDDPESVELEPNDGQDSANELTMCATANGRFDTPDDADWYRLRLPDKEVVWLEVNAHCYLHSPVDTYLQVYDAKGKLLAENDDDGFRASVYVSIHDFGTTDSGIRFTPPEAGDYFVRISNQSNVHGPRAVYRLSTLYPNKQSNVRIRHYPDAVPIWGPGSTASLMVEFNRVNWSNDDVTLSIEGLPKGWKGSRTVALGTNNQRPKNPYSNRVFMTITAPQDAAPGTIVPFHIVGRATREENTVVQISKPLTRHYSSDIGFFRVTPQSYAAVAKPRDLRLEAMVEELTIKQGEKTTIPVRVHGAPDAKEIPLVVNLAQGIQCNLGAPVTLPIKEDRIVQVPLVGTEKMPIGTFAITVAQTWRSDIRIGMPGPCTSLIRLHVKSK